jgi:hypothetical protein
LRPQPPGQSWIAPPYARRSNTGSTLKFSNFGLVVRPGPGSDWTTLGYQPRDNAEDYREMLRGKGVDVDEPHREEWEWPETAARLPVLPDTRLGESQRPRRPGVRLVTR